MTQALNLANFANKLNTSGQTDNSGLQNSSVTVTAGTGLSGGGAVALGSSVTLTNAGVTSIVAGSGISISGATGAVTITNSSSGGVSSLNGQTGAITNTTFNTIGSYTGGAVGISQVNAGDTVAGSSIRAAYNSSDRSGPFDNIIFSDSSTYYNPGCSGTWRAMARTKGISYCGTQYGPANLWVRVS